MSRPHVSILLLVFLFDMRSKVATSSNGRMTVLNGCPPSVVTAASSSSSLTLSVSIVDARMANGAVATAAILFAQLGLTSDSGKPPMLLDLCKFGPVGGFVAGSGGAAGGIDIDGGKGGIGGGRGGLMCTGHVGAVSIGTVYDSPGTGIGCG